LGDLIGVEDPIIVLGVLEKVLCADAIARCMRIARERLILFVNMSGCAADFHLRTVAVESPVREVVGFPATPSPFRVWSLPHVPKYFSVVLLVAPQESARLIQSRECLHALHSIRTTAV
jgi:hypothetical protein